MSIKSLNIKKLKTEDRKRKRKRKDFTKYINNQPSQKATKKIK